MWQKPYGYKEGFAVCGGLFLIGTLWQMVLGPCSLSLLVWPVNVFVGIGYVLFLVGISFFFRQTALVCWMSSPSAAITSMISVVVLTVMMGLTRQYPDTVVVEGIGAWFGFSQMLSAGSFVLLLFWLITLVGMVTIRRFFKPKWGDVPFMLNHLGLFLALTGAVLGSGDMQRLEMTTQVGKPEWRAINDKKVMVELPLAIELHEFSIDEYPPKLMVIDNSDGKVLPKGKAENLLLEDDVKQGKLLDWEITIKERIPYAASMATEDTLKFVGFHSIGAAYAVYIDVLNKKTQEHHHGWVSCGSFMFPYKSLRLNEANSIIMPEREPKRFASHVTVYTVDGALHEDTIAVNSPLAIAGWKIYQLSYDEEKGRWSDISVFELVSDPWLPVVYTGIWMMIAGAICLFALTHKRKEDES